MNTRIHVPLFDYGDVYRNARKGVLERLDFLYHAAFRPITNAPRTHYCELYSLLNWTSLHIRREIHWYIFIYKVWFVTQISTRVAATSY